MTNDEMRDQIEASREAHEYLTFFFVKEKDGDPSMSCGVVQNSTSRFVSFYDLARIRDANDRKTFMAMADQWWWESGMSLPIDSYIGQKFDYFQFALRSVPKKTLAEDPIGPVYSLADRYLRRIKKRRVELVSRHEGEVA